MAKKTLYQVLQVQSGADAEVIKAAYAARLAALEGSSAPEVNAERTIVREAYELLIDPVRRKLYDEKLREERFRALSSGGGIDEPRARPANARIEQVEIERSSPTGLIAGVGIVLAICIGGGWVWLDHKRKADAQRLQEMQIAEEMRQKDERARLQRETVDWAKDRIDADRRTAEERRQDAQRAADNRRIEYERQQLARQAEADARRAQMEQQRAEQEQRRRDLEEQRRSQQQLDRDRRYLQELERNRGMSIPQR